MVWEEIKYEGVGNGSGLLWDSKFQMYAEVNCLILEF